MIKNEEHKDTLLRYRKMFSATKSPFVKKLLGERAKKLNEKPETLYNA